MTMTKPKANANRLNTRTSEREICGLGDEAVMTGGGVGVREVPHSRQ